LAILHRSESPDPEKSIPENVQVERVRF
jgi:hypothetical protein